MIDTVRKNLFEGGLLVVAVLFAFLGNLRAALIVALAIPLSMLFAFCGMLRFGIAASLLSLGAIDFGMIVDSSVVMVENCVRHLAARSRTGNSRLEIIRDAAVEVRKPTMFGELIIMIVYLPILTLEGVEGKTVPADGADGDLRPGRLDDAVADADAGAGQPACCRRRIDEREPLLDAASPHRDPLPAPAVRACTHKAAGARLRAPACWSSPSAMIAPEPRLRVRAPAVGRGHRHQRRPAGRNRPGRVDPLQHADGKGDPGRRSPTKSSTSGAAIGTAEIATDPMGVELTDMFITLKPRDAVEEGPHPGRVDRADRQDLRDLPGQRLAYSQPIEMRMNEMVSGVRADLAVKLFGDDFDVLAKKADEIEAVLRSIPGAADVNAEQITGQPVLQIKVNQDQIARYGVPAKAVLDLVESIGSKPLGEVVEGQLRFPLVVRLPEKFRDSPEAIGAHAGGDAAGRADSAVAAGEDRSRSRGRRRSRANGASGG